MTAIDCQANSTFLRILKGKKTTYSTFKTKLTQTVMLVVGIHETDTTVSQMAVRKNKNHHISLQQK